MHNPLRRALLAAGLGLPLTPVHPAYTARCPGSPPQNQIPGIADNGT